MMAIDWQILLKRAYELAKTSPDPSTQNAALLVNENGFILTSDVNRPPDGVVMSLKRWERPLKYKVVEHAERNVIFASACKGVYPLRGTTMVCPWAACADCARAIIQSGITMLVTHQQAHDRSPDFWRKEIEIAFEMLEEAHIPVMLYDGVVGVEGVLHSGQLWNP